MDWLAQHDNPKKRNILRLFFSSSGKRRAYPYFFELTKDPFCLATKVIQAST